MVSLIGGACATVPPPPPGGSLEALLERPDARVMWVGAHPDDESLAAPILARACKALHRPCLLLVLNHGDGGECLLRQGCFPDLATVRGRELREVARRYGAQLEHHRLYNAPLPIESFPPRHEIAQRWLAEEDVGAIVARAIRRFRPTILLTFDPNRGFTGHPEHQLASRFAMEGAVRAASASETMARGSGARAADPLGPYRVPNVYQLLSSTWIVRLLGRADPAEPTETFDTHVPCGAPGRTCLDVALRIERAHLTQAKDMATIRMLRPQIGHLYLRRIEVEREHALDPPTERVASND
ncbi:MAG: PIG-L family deacetylase [Deltaproteobacteria bacterium]|nr:PIG-L family deacetylase [Deltaproteobacteria bacterium]